MSKYSLPPKDEKFVLSEESARDQIVTLLDYYDIDVDRLAGDERGQQVVEKALDQLTLFVRRGVLEVTREPKLVVTQQLSGGDVLTYREIDSKAKLAMEKFDPTAGYSRIYAFMGSLCGLGKTAIEKLPARDLGVVEILGTVFLNA